MDWKYIIKRVIIGVLIALIIMLIKGNLLIGVSAKTISPYNTNGYYEDITSAYSSTTFTIPGAPYKSHGVGVLRFSLAITKTGGSSTDPILVPRLIQAYSGSSTAYVCNFGSTTNSNSTWTGQSYSVECPMNIDSNGLTQILVAYVPFSQQSNSTFRVQFAPNISYEYGDSYDNGSSAVNSEAQAQGNATRNTIENATDDIINNNNQNTQDIIDSTKVCKQYDKTSTIEVGTLSDSGSINSSATGYGITDYVYIYNSDVKILNIATNNLRSCFYNVNKSLISCINMYELTNFNVPTNSYYARFTINLTYNRPTFEVCTNGNQAIADGQQQINDTLTNSNVDSSTSNGSNFFLQFADPVNPLQDVIMFPINLLSASVDSCSPITLTYLNHDIIIPCGDTIFWNKSFASSFRTWWNLFFGGFAIYLLCFKLFHIISDSFDPFKDDVSKVGGILD